MGETCLFVVSNMTIYVSDDCGEVVLIWKMNSGIILNIDVLFSGSL